MEKALNVKSGKSVKKRVSYKNRTSYKTIVIWLCCLWALGLGARMSLELLLSDGWVHVPRHPLNIYFDFLPLCIFGCVTVFYTTKELFKVAQVKGFIEKPKEV